MSNLVSANDILDLFVNVPAALLEGICELNGAPLQLEPYQLRWLNDRSVFRIANKSRQIGLSTVLGAEVFHRGLITPLLRTNYEANIVSVNQREASSKIDLVRMLYHSIPDQLREGNPKLKADLWSDSQYEIAFGRPPYQGKIISQPASSAIRGGRKDIYFDEAAHIRDFKKLYQAALPAITRGDSRISIISTPLGQSGLFYDIFTNTKDYPEFTRHSIPWWESKAMVIPALYEEALATADQYSTDLRIKKFGTEKLQSIYRSFGADLIGFQTEYEATFVDEIESYYPWDLVISCKDDDQVIWTEWPSNYEPKGWLSIGMDLAKEHDQTVMVVAEVIEDGDDTKYVVRMVKAMRETYEEQFRTLTRLINLVKPNRVSIDATGVGQVFVERSKRELQKSTNVEGVVFTNAKKERWATQVKGDMQLGKVSYPFIPDLLKQINGIRRTKTENNFYKFAGLHDDYFWAMMLAFYGEGRVTPRIYSL